MKLFTQLALVSAIAVSGNAFALQAMDDAAMSATTGRDGITVKIDTATGIKIDKLFIHDNDGLTAGLNGGTGNAGAIVLGDGVTKAVSITKVNAGDKLLTLAIDTDGGATAGNAFLNIGVNLAETNIAVGPIKVGTSASTMTNLRRGTTGTDVDILSGLNLHVGATSLNVQLGNQPQGAMIKLNANVIGGIALSNVSLKDADGSPLDPTAGAITIGNLQLANASSADLSVDASVDVDATNGLVVTMNGTNKYDAYITSVSLGAVALGSIGDVEIQGLDLGGASIAISGH